MTVTKEAIEAARQIVEPNVVMGDIDDDTAVINAAGLIGDVAAALSTLPIAGEAPAELSGPLQWAMHDAFEASEADTTAGKMIAVYDVVRSALVSSPGKVRPLTCQCGNSITDPCIVCGKPKTLVTAEWAKKMTAREGDLDPTTGIPSPGKDGGNIDSILDAEMSDGWTVRSLLELAASVMNGVDRFTPEQRLSHALNSEQVDTVPGKDGGQEVEAGDLRQRIEEVFAWRKTGVLPGEALRDMATAIRERHGEVFSQGDALSMAEKQTAEEAMRIVLSRPQPASTALVERLEAARDEQWNLRRDAEGSRDAARAAADSLRIERDTLRTVLSDVLSAWDFWDVNPHDREPPRDAISRARAALSSTKPEEVER